MHPRISVMDGSSIPLSYQFKDHVPQYFVKIRKLCGIRPNEYQVNKNSLFLCVYL